MSDEASRLRRIKRYADAATMAVLVGVVLLFAWPFRKLRGVEL